VKAKDNRILRKRKLKLAMRLERKQWSDQSEPMFAARNISYEMAERINAIPCGGIGATGTGPNGMKLALLYAIVDIL